LKSSPPGKIIEAIQELHAGGSPISSQIARQVIAAFREMPLNRQGFPTAPLIGRPETWAGKEDIVHHPDLSPRESEVLHWLAKGYLYKEVGAQLAMSTATVRAHVQRIYRKLQVHSKTAAASKIRLG
jgi:DNA-binding NarL/FixJ family response regulator